MSNQARRIPPNLHIWRLTFAFFATGLIFFLFTLVLGIRMLPEMTALQSARIPSGWLLTHTLLLGFATMIAMGASYQLTQVIMRTSLYSRALGYFHYFIFTFGIVGLLAGFIGDPAWNAWGGTGVAIGTLLFTFNVVATFIRKREWNLFVLGVSLSLLCLLLMIVMGIAMSVGMAFGWDWTIGQYDAVFGTHIWLGVGGWLSGLILIYSFKLLPMFYVSRKKPNKAAWWIIGVFHAGIWLHVAALWLDAASLAACGDALVLAALGGGFLFFRAVRAMSSGKQPIGVVAVAYWLWPIIFFLVLIWRIVHWSALEWGMLNETLVLILILGWFAASIFAYLSKIFPFLWWALRYQTKEQKKAAPLLSEMIAESRMARELCGYLASIAVIAAGFMMGWPKMVLIGQMAALVVIVTYLVELLRVFRH